jgi:methionyl-tRNA formyltransferase
MGQRYLFLGAESSPLLWHMRGVGDEIRQTEDRITPDKVLEFEPRGIVSHGYRHILKSDVLGLGVPAINMHISVLPWNRGADPNLWSWIDGTPKGVSLHYMDEGIDTGKLIVHQPHQFTHDNHTLASSYELLQHRAAFLFRNVWHGLRVRWPNGYPQQPGGSYHTTADRAKVEHLLTDGWDTPVSALRPLDVAA